MKKLKLNIKGMSCYVSENRIQTGFGYLKGVEKSESNCQTGEFYCQYDPDLVTEEEIIKRLEDMEFEVHKK
jgi:Cu+-exporting ATPase